MKKQINLKKFMSKNPKNRSFLGFFRHDFAWQAKSGFTLLELLVVVAIVGILIAITMVMLSDAKSKGKDTAKIQTLSDIRKSLQLYATDKGGFPSSLDSLVSGKYISSIDSAILYTGKDNSGGICGNNLCSSYHLAIPLTSANNTVLKSDADVVDSVIDGTNSTCKTGGSIAQNLCYDITP